MMKNSIYDEIYDNLNLDNGYTEMIKFQLYVELRYEVDNIKMSEEMVENFYNGYLSVAGRFDEYYSVSDFADFISSYCRTKDIKLIDLDLDKMIEECFDKDGILSTEWL